MAPAKLGASWGYCEGGGGACVRESGVSDERAHSGSAHCAALDSSVVSDMIDFHPHSRKRLGRGI